MKRPDGTLYPFPYAAQSAHTGDPDSMTASALFEAREVVSGVPLKTDDRGYQAASRMYS